jgi:hypothetical protein
MGPFIVKDGYSFVRDRDININSIAEWIFKGTGAIASGRAEATYAFISNHSKSQGNTDFPDVHTYVISVSSDTRTEFDFQRSFNFNPRSAEYFAHSQGKDSFLTLISLNSPKGRGYMKLRNKCPHSPLIINPKYLEETDDIKVLLEGTEDEM